MTSERKWQGFPARWPETSGTLEGLDLRCPCCDEGYIRYFYQYSEERFRKCGIRRGGFWIWCPACYRYEHANAEPPLEWVNIPNVPDGVLGHNPEWLNEHWDEISQSPNYRQPPK